jgi:hypothetical protein
MLSPNRPNELVLTAHGRRRVRSRGFLDLTVLALLGIADRAVPVGRGCVALSASAATLAAAQVEGLTPAQVERLAGRVVVLDSNGRVVTALVQQGRRGRRYGRVSSGSARQRLHGRQR